MQNTISHLHPHQEQFLRFAATHLLQYLDIERESQNGDCYPQTPELVVRMAERFFRAGFLAADCECVARTVDEARR